MLTLLRKLEPGEDAALRAGSGGVSGYVATGTSQATLATGRAALAHLIRVCRWNAGDAVLMPAYVAEGVIRPFTAAGMRVAFYKLTATLEPDLGDLQRVLTETPDARAVVVVHHFGFEAPVGRVKQLAMGRGALVVEDCAHALFSRYASGAPFGSVGDVALYSLNKFLPVADGALLVSRSPGIDVTVDEAAAPPLHPAAEAAYLEHLGLNGDLLRCAEPRAAAALIARSGDAYERYYGHVNADLSLRRMSDRSRGLYRTFPADALVAARRRNVRLSSPGWRRRHFRSCSRRSRNASCP